MTLPNSAGVSISELKTGQVILVNKQRKVVASIDGFSGICTDGTILTCHTGHSIEATQEFVAEVELEMGCAELLDEHGLLEDVEAKIEAYNREH